MDGRKWEWFSSLGFFFISAVHSRSTQPPSLVNDNYQITINNFFKCMLHFSQISIASMVDYEALKGTTKPIVPLASPNSQERVWFLNLVLLSGNVGYNCRQDVDKCLKSRFGAWDK